MKKPFWNSAESNWVRLVPSFSGVQPNKFLTRPKDLFTTLSAFWPQPLRRQKPFLEEVRTVISVKFRLLKIEQILDEAERSLHVHCEHTSQRIFEQFSFSVTLLRRPKPFLEEVKQKSFKNKDCLRSYHPAKIPKIWIFLLWTEEKFKFKYFPGFLP